MADVIADFRGEITFGELDEGESTEGRIVSNREELVFVTPSRELRVHHDDIVDIVEKQPVVDAEFVDTVLNIVCERDGKKCEVFVGADPETVTRFRHVILNSILSEEDFRATYPKGRDGGRTGPEVIDATIELAADELRIEGEDGTDEIRLSSVTDFERSAHRFDGREKWPAVRIRYVEEGETKTTLVGRDDPRELNLLGRHLQIEYTNLRERVNDADVTKREVDAMVSIYTDGADTLGDALGVEPEEAESILSELETKGLVSTDGADVSPTETGRVLASERLDATGR